MIVHELDPHRAGHVARTAGDSAADELDAMQAQHDACELITFTDDPPRGCLDAQLLVEDPDAIEQLVDAGYRR